MQLAKINTVLIIISIYFEVIISPKKLPANLLFLLFFYLNELNLCFTLCYDI